MKYITFYRENNNFDDIQKDVTIKKLIREKTSWYQHLMLGIINDEKVFSYITLKYGDSISTHHIKDFSPIINIDYIPKR